MLPIIIMFSIIAIFAITLIAININWKKILINNQLAWYERKCRKIPRQNIGWYRLIRKPYYAKLRNLNYGKAMK